MADANAQELSEKMDGNKLHELFWMEGTWKGVAAGSPFFEAYEVMNDTLMRINYYSDSSLSKVEATGTVSLENDAIFHTYGKSRWKLAKREGNTWYFEPVAHASNTFSWSVEGPDKWKAEVVAGGRVSKYLMERMQ